MLISGRRGPIPLPVSLHKQYRRFPLASSKQLKENAEALVAATREIELEVSADKTKYMVMSRDQNAGRIQRVRTDSSTFERVEEFKYLGTTSTNQILF